jgi:hypothetical protein
MAFWNRFVPPPRPARTHWELRIPAGRAGTAAGRILAVPARPAGGAAAESRALVTFTLVPDGRIQGRWTQKWPSKITCGLGNQRPRKRPNFLIAAWYEQKLAKIAQEQSLAERERRLMKPKFWITSSRNLTCMVIVRQSWQYQVLKPTKEEMPQNVMYCCFTGSMKNNFQYVYFILNSFIPIHDRLLL